MTDRLFVYGTLAPGQANGHLLEPLSGRWQQATIRGMLDPAGWGATNGFPAVVLDPRAGEVSGWLFTSTDLREQWDRLDAFEGPAYRRVRAQARLGDGRCVGCFVYELNQAGVQP